MIVTEAPPAPAPPLVWSVPQTSVSASRRAIRKLAKRDKPAGRDPIPIMQLELIRRRLVGTFTGLVCSDPWADVCESAIVRGAAPAEHPEDTLRFKGIYPPADWDGHVEASPGGMTRCSCCRRWSPRARYGRLRTATPNDDGSVTVTFTPWRPVCIDCFYCRMPIGEMVHVPSSPGYSTRIPDGEMTPHYPFQKRSKRVRWRFDR